MPKGFFHGSTTAQSVAPPATVPRCGACGLHKGCLSPKMPPGGKGGRRVLVVGEAPGEQEDKDGKQFVGPAGQYLRAAMRQHGFDLGRDCWVTNTLICRPPNNDTPTNEQIDHCLPNLNKTIKEYNPEIIIPLGKAACRAVVGPLWRDDMDDVGTWVGWRIPSIELNAWVCPNYHPSYILRAKEKEGTAEIWFNRYLERALDLEGRPWAVPPQYHKEIDVILDVNEAARIIEEWTIAGGVFAFDYETNMRKPDAEDARIVSCSICRNGKKTIAYPWAGAAIEATDAFLRSPHPKIASNKKFEQRWSKRILGHGVRGWYWDTMQSAHVLDNRRGVCSIKFQAFVRFGFPVYNKHIEPYLRSRGSREANQILREININDLLLYNGLDSLLEYKVGIQQMKEMGYPLPGGVA